MRKAAAELNKKELRKEITWLKKELITFRKGGAPAYEYESYNSLLTIKEIALRYINELRSRTATTAEQTTIDAFFNEYFKADKMLENKLGI